MSWENLLNKHWISIIVIGSIVLAIFVVLFWQELIISSFEVTCINETLYFDSKQAAIEYSEKCVQKYQ